MIPELKQSIDSKKYYRPPIIKLSKKTKRKVANIELFILELFEKAYSFLTLSLIILLCDINSHPYFFKLVCLILSFDFTLPIQ
jgi:hypothetical protein